jgi:hypothetical protein
MRVAKAATAHSDCQLKQLSRRIQKRDVGRGDGD